MQHLNRGMLSRYDIPEHAPGSVRVVQFGLSEALLGVADRLLDEVRPDLGIACVPGTHAGEGADPAALLREQEGLFTLLVRGYEGERAVKREVVVQSILHIIRGEEALSALAREPDLALGLLDTESPGAQEDLRAAARLLSERRRAGLGGLRMICLGEAGDCADRAREAVAAEEPELTAWLEEACAFLPALADGLVCRADAKEAARQCAEMNYLDGMLHLAEPWARLTIRGTDALRKLLVPGEGGPIEVVDDLEPALQQKRRWFDAGLFAMAAPGWLLGLDTLCDCMKHERLRAFVGRVYNEELLPADSEARRAAAPPVIRAFERFENPLNRNAILPSSRPLLGRFNRAVLPILREAAGRDFEPPRRLTFALAATIMLYAGARPGAGGLYEVARGDRTEILYDDPAALAVFATLAHDMPPETLAYAVLADRELWQGEDLRKIDGLEARVALDIAHLQRVPDWLPEA